MLYFLLIFIIFFYFINYFNILIFNHIILSKLAILLVPLVLLKLSNTPSLIWRVKLVYILIIIYLYFNFWQLSLKCLNLFHSFFYLLSFNKC